MKAPAKSIQLPAPTGGWDTRNALADMPANNAVILDNWFPDIDRVIMRKGYASHATGMTGNVDTLMRYTSVAGAESLFAANGTSIYDVTSAGSVGSAAVGSLTNARWQHAQIGTAGGNFLIAVNGADTPITFDGSSWSTASITGPTAANLAWINLHQRRLWFGEDDSLTAWYLPVNSIAGAASSFSLAGIAKLGGYIMAMGTWTRDAGDGADDVAVFITSEGEAIVYQGTDPSSATTWALVGVFRLGVPIGRRCFTKAGADLILITEDGFVPVSTILGADRSQAERVAISAQINKAVSDAVQSGASLFGWQPFIYPRGRMLMFNIPTSTTVFHQYVFNTITNAPCRFTGMNARCWEMLNDEAYFGGTDGVVYKGLTGNADGGSTLTADALQAYNDFRKPGVRKAFMRAEPILISSVEPDYAVRMNLDYRSVAAGTPTAGRNSGNSVYRGWRGVTGVAYTAGIRLKATTTDAQPAWVATNLMYMEGGLL